MNEQVPREMQVYYELGPTGLDDLPPNLLHACRVAMGCLTRKVFSSAAVKSLMNQSGPVGTPSTRRAFLRDANSG